MFDLLIRNGRVVDGTGLPWVHADVGIERRSHRGRRTARHRHREADPRRRGEGRLPRLRRRPRSRRPRAACRSGSRAGRPPGRDHATFSARTASPSPPGSADNAGLHAAIHRRLQRQLPHARPRVAHVTEYLAQFDGQCSINACTLIPNGNVRMEVMGLDPRKPTADELKQMRAPRPRRDGAGRGRAFQRPRLRAEPLCRRGRTRRAVRRDRARSAASTSRTCAATTSRRPPPALQEVFNIGQRAGCGVHVSHFNCLADQTIPLLDAARARRRGRDLRPLLLPLRQHDRRHDYSAAGGPRRAASRRPWSGSRTRPHAPSSKRRSPTRASRSRRCAWRVCRTTSTGISRDRRCPPRPRPRQQTVLDFTCDLLIATNLAAGCVIRHFAARQESDITQADEAPAHDGRSATASMSAASRTRAARAASRAISGTTSATAIGRWKKR